MPLELVETTTFRLEGEFIKITITSGTDVRHMATPVARFIANHTKAKVVIAEWHAKQAKVVRLGKRRKGN